jgi:ketosteroid isomerase-like protein
MDGDVELLKRIYDCFNARDIDGVLAVLADDVAWANGMDGGRRTVSKTRRSDTFSVFERARWLASTYRMLPSGQDLFRARTL